MFMVSKSAAIAKGGWRRELYPLCWAFGLFVFLPNTLFWMVSHWLVMERATFNLDYIFVGILIARGWIFFGVLLFAVFFLTDVLVLIGQMYPFLRLNDLLYLLGLLVHAPTYLKLVVVLALLFLFGVTGLLIRHGKKITILSVMLPLNLGLLLYGIYVYGNESTAERMWRPDQGVLVDSQTINFIEGRTSGFTGTFSIEGEPFKQTGFKGRTAVWAELPVQALSPKLLLIVAESWGSYVDKNTQEAILAPVYAKQSGLDWIKTGEMSVVGATVTGELRELCGLYPNHFNLKGVEVGFEGCLPNKLRAAGYNTEAIHGAVGLMYDRIYWYPRVGFDKSHFMETDTWNSRCYSFPGICDSEIMQSFLPKIFSRDGKQFMYWLTLNSHAIYDDRDLHGDRFDCKSHGLPEDTGLCRMSRLHAQFFRNLAALLEDASMRGVEIIVVGDHMPPMVDTNEGGNYVKNSTVSWLHLKVGEG